MRARLSVLVVVVCIAVLMLAFGLPTASARGTSDLSAAHGWGHTIVVKPNGYNDTADLQAAFNTCTSHNWVCTVQLVKGTYYTDQIYAYGFLGSFMGAGQGRTVIQALPNLAPPNPADNTPTMPFWAAAPTTATGGNPWPNLFTFVNGTFGISGMSMAEPYATPIASPGYFNSPDAAPGVESTSLYAVVLVTGTEAYATLDQVTVVGAAGDITIPVGVPSTFNLADGIVYEGMLLPSGWTSMWGDQIPLSGTFSVTGSVSDYSISAIWAQNLLDASVTVCHNFVDSSPSPGFWDISNTQFVFCGNRVTNVAAYTGFGGIQSYYKSDLLPSTVYVTDNYFGTNWMGSGPSFIDLGPAFWGVPSTLSAVIVGNTIVSNNSCECFTESVTDVIIGDSLASLVVSQNTILGGGGGVFSAITGGINIGVGSSVITGNTIRGAYDGVYLDGANNTYVTGNTITNSVQYGIAVTNGSSYNLIEWNLVKGSGVYVLNWDGTGTGNVWSHNYCKTSSPSGLC